LIDPELRSRLVSYGEVLNKLIMQNTLPELMTLDAFCQCYW